MPEYEISFISTKVKPHFSSAAAFTDTQIQWKLIMKTSFFPVYFSIKVQPLKDFGSSHFPDFTVFNFFLPGWRNRADSTRAMCEGPIYMSIHVVVSGFVCAASPSRAAKWRSHSSESVSIEDFRATHTNCNKSPRMDWKVVVVTARTLPNK